MENIIVTELGNGYYRLTPKKGYILKFGNHTYSVAEVKSTEGWETMKL